ncbi:MAG: hypothetical protein VB055_09150 [Oscillospiraceae bacterium]|nr:hypothetical protein [Oscillospiraceae bacterium]
MERLIAAEGRTLLCLAVAACALLYWVLRYFHAMAPRKGTLEWIAATDRGRFSLPAAEMLGQGRWQALLGAALLGAAVCPVRLLTLSPVQWPEALVSALSAAAFCELLLALCGSVPAALCGTALLLACGMPTLPMLLGLCSLLLFFLFLTAGKVVWRVLLAVLSAGALAVAGTLEAGYWALGAGFLLTDLLAAVLLRCGARKHPALTAILELFGLALLLLAAVVGARAGYAAMMGSQSYDWTAMPKHLPLPILSLPSWDRLPALLPLLVTVAVLTRAFRARDGRCLLCGLLGLSCLPLCFFGAAETACVGGILALAATFAGGWKRGARAPVILTTCLLILSILLV